MTLEAWSEPIRHNELSDVELHAKIRSLDITLGGNRRLKIYGRLGCSTGKRMKRSNRVFFAHAQTAKDAGYRPCGHCMKSDYQEWIYSAQN